MTHILISVAILASCSARSNNFGDPPDSGASDMEARDATGDGTDDPAGVGETCSGPADCVDGALCIGDTSGEFRCMAICASAYDLCDDGSVCLPVMTQDASICYTGGATPIAEECVNNLGCESGLLCFGAGGEFYCRPACDDAAETCDAGDYCLRLDSGAGLCRSAVGSACSTSADCGDATCSLEIPEIGGAFSGGYCTAACSDDSDCPGGSVCRSVPSTSQGICLQACAHRSECRFNGDYDCHDASICDASSAPNACRAMFGEDSLCVPGAF